MKSPIRQIGAVLCLTVLVGWAAASTTYADAISDAAPQTITLSGTTSFDGWASFSNTTMTGYGSYPGTGAWTGTYGSSVVGTIGSNVVGSADAYLSKVSNGTGGGPYVGGSSIYFGGSSTVANTNGGALAITDETPLLGLETIVLQLEIGQVYGHSFFNDALPTLTYTYNDGTGDVTVSSVASTYSNILVQVQNGTMMGEPVYVNLYALQWDLSAVTGEIIDYTINFNAVQHAQVYAAQVNQSDTMTQAVPEPSTYAMLIAGSAMLFWRMRRRESLA